MVFYRKYRPQKINDLDSDSVRHKLFSVLSNSAPTFLQVPHAFLFTGPKGLGKTSTARIVAKVINCTGRTDTSGKNIEPCNECEQCISITNGNNLDVYEIDAASNRGIDEIRDLKEKIRLSPVGAKKKVYIIDEVHMLTTEAFNALLKTLEEPPSHAIFILCTTESHKVPATILSRCLHISFKKATIKELVRAFKRIVEGEKLEVSDELLEKIAKLSDGGFRDGTKILEELVALSGGGKITDTVFEEKHQITSIRTKIETLLKACEEREIKTAFDVVATLQSEGIDSSFFLSELVLTLHAVLLQKVGIETDNSFETSLDIAEVKSLIHLFSRATSEMKYTVVPMLPLELALIEWCQESSEFKVQNSELQAEKVVTQKSEVTVSTLRRQAGNIAKDRAVNPTATSGQVSSIKQNNSQPAEVSILKYRATGDHTQEWMDALWKNTLSEVKSHNHMIAGVLRSCRLVSYDREVLIIEAAAKFHKEKLEEAKTFAALTDVCATLIGNPVQIKIELKSN